MECKGREMSYSDILKAGRSARVPYIEGENPSDRHARRFEMSLHDMVTLNAWAKLNGFMVRVHNEGHHWEIVRGQFVADWYPSSAKLVLYKMWHRGIHCHDVGQVIAKIGRVMGI
jgi:hypothetical protein